MKDEIKRKRKVEGDKSEIEKDKKGGRKCIRVTTMRVETTLNEFSSSRAWLDLFSKGVKLEFLAY